MRCLKIVLIVSLISNMNIYASAAEIPPQKTQLANTEKQELLLASAPRDDRHFWTHVNERTADMRPGSDQENEQAKAAWYELLGFDPFVPYYKAEEIQEAVEDKTKVTIWKFHGKAKFDTRKEKAKYVFVHKF